jgi:hypothetical protein
MIDIPQDLSCSQTFFILFSDLFYLSGITLSTQTLFSPGPQSRINKKAESIFAKREKFP